YPEIELETDFSDRRVAVIEEGFDAVIRVGDTEDSRLMSRQLGTFHLQLVAAPDYLRRAGIPRQPAELRDHACLLYRFPTTGKVETWPVAG
ncbi:LysR substrate-binding domain-containing protein, partial [Clostridium perfringens]